MFLVLQSVFHGMMTGVIQMPVMVHAQSGFHSFSSIVFFENVVLGDISSGELPGCVTNPCREMSLQ